MSENRAGSAGLDGGGGDNGDPGGGAVCGPIENGIQLQTKDRKQPLASFTYAWAPTTEVAKPLDWTAVSKEDVQYNHIRCYELQEGDNLSEVVAKVNSNQCAQALILVNTEDSYLIDPKFLTGKEQLKLPILVLTSESGKTLITALSQYPQNTEAKVLKFPIQVQSTGAVVDSSLTKTSQPATNGSDTDRLIVRDIQDTQQLQQPFHQKPIENGLVLKIEGEQAPRYFTYAWSPTTERPQQISDWVAISDGAIEQFHIRCYQLTEKENDIQLLVAELDSKATAALILINNKDDYQIESRFFPENEKWEFPILIVPSGSGKDLMEIVTKRVRNVTAKVEVSSIQELRAREIVSECVVRSRAPQTDIPWNMVTRIEEIMFPANSQPKIVSEEIAVFQVVMSEFHVYETTEQSQETEKKLFTLLIEKLQHTFQKDFLFYIALAYRTRFLKHRHYQSKSPQEFVNVCFEKFEELDTVHVAPALDGFFERKDFSFHLGLKETPDPQQHGLPVVEVFQFIEQAFNRLMKERKIKEYRIYPTMLWITTYLSFCAKRQLQESDEKIWQDYFLKDAHRYKLDSDNIEGLKKALALGQTLKLPTELTFSTSLLGKLLSPTDKLTRPFDEQKTTVTALEKYNVILSSTEEFMEHVVLRLKEAYGRSLQQSGLRKFLQKVTNCTPPQAIKDGLSLLDAMLKVVNSRSLQHDEGFQQWILLLLSLTKEASAPVLAECLQEVLSQQYTVTRKYHCYIIEQTRACLKGLPVKHFCSVYKCDPISWGPEILTEYLDGYKIPAHIDISDDDWKCFFELVVEKFPGAANQRHLYKFLTRVADCYQKQREPSKLIVDLMKLGVPGLFSVLSDDDKPVVTEFENELRGFIHKNSVISQIGGIMDCITLNDSFQEVILATVLKEMITHPKDLLQPSFSRALNIAVRELCCREGHSTTEVMSWLHCEPSPKQLFCLDFVNECCTRISNKFANIQSIDWAMFSEYFSLITKVGTLYSFSKSKQGQSTLCDALQVVVTRNPSSSVRSYFEWIQKFHLMFADWKSRLQEKKGSYEEISWYIQNSENIYSLASAVAATSLVVSEVEVKGLKDVFLENLKKLNQLILRYIPSDPKSGCCSIISILSEYKAKLPQELQSELSANIIFPDESERAATTECAKLPSPYSATDVLKPPTNTCLIVSKQLSLYSLCQLVEWITAFLDPVKPYMDLLVYFHLHNSYLFSTHMHHALSAIPTDERTPEQVHKAVDHVKALLVKVLNGTATYGEIFVENFKLEMSNVDEEFSTLLECQSLREYGATGSTGMKSLLKLLQFVRPILTLKQVFEQYDLDCCLNDPEFKELNELALMLQDSEKRANISINDAKQKWETVHKALCLKKDASPKCLELFSKVADNADFYHFLKEKELVGTPSSAEFRHKVEVITRHQELDDYQEMVLNHLIAAFTFIAPIIDHSYQSLNSLMSAVTALELPEELPQFETVRKTMHLIQFWFSRSEDTPENVSSELNGILESGSYHIETTNATVTRRSRLRLVLKFELSFLSASTAVSRDQSTPEIQERAGQEVIKFQSRTLTVEKVEDFVHRLELLKGEDQNVQTFLHLNEVAYRLLEVFEKLQELGHPELSRKPFKYTLSCSALIKQEVSATDSILENWKDKVGNWMEKVKSLHDSNKWLLFFRVPKLIMLYEALTTEKPSVVTIIQEIGFLFQRNAHTNKGFKSAVKIAVDTCRQGSHSEQSPMEIVGSFLDHRYQVEVKKWSLPVRCKKKYTHLPQANNVLYNATGYTESELVRLILGLYGGPPEAFEFLHCEPTTTEQELRLLMKRAIHHPRLYLLAEVNNLPYQLQEVLLQLLLQLKHQQTRVYFIETAPSLLREVSYLKFIDYKEEVPMDMNKAQIICKETGLQRREEWSRIELVYGMPGNGKTHYIRDKMKNVPENHQVTIAINEAFTSVSAIERLRTLPRDAKNCAIFFNFTIFPPMNETDAREEEPYRQLMKNVRWFFFELLILGYVEDPATGLSFHFPAGLSWALYTEVPSRATKTPAHFLKYFEEEVPALALLGTPVDIDLQHDYHIDEDVQLVCKYLRSYENRKIDRVCGRKGNSKIKFSTDPRVSDAECKRLLQKYMSDHIKETKITQKLFIQYMKRRCTFLDNLPAFNYNTGYGEYIGERQKTDTRHLGSTLMQTMLKEVTDFCDPRIKESWSQEAHQQLIYDFSDGGGSFGLICLLPDDPRLQADKKRFKEMGVEIPSLDDLYSRAVLDKYLSRALGVPLSKDGRLSPIDKRQYVLTLDYTLKMLNIHERYECGVPVIIEGETGVGKTALIEMLSELWNHSWIAEWNRDKDRLVDLMHRKMGDQETDTVDESQRAYGACVEALHNLSTGQMVTEEMWNTIAQLPDGRFESGQFYSVLNRSLLKLEGDLKFAMLNLKLNAGEKLVDVFTAIKTQQCSKTTAHLLYIIFSATVKSAFHKKNIHTDLQPMEIEEFFAEVILQADELQQVYDAARRPQQLRVPSVTAYLDEINTASCLGLFKEIIVDRTINGKHIPENVFIIASCNPHRGDVLTLIHDKDHESWLKGTYYVRKLHPTLDHLKWDYGSLNQQQEKEYVNAKMKILSQQSMSPQDDSIYSLAALIVESQQRMRDYALEQLQSLNIPETDDWLKHCANSSVSQRDIQRVFKFYLWLMKTYAIRFDPEKKNYHRRAMLVSLGIVYFMRLSSKYRSKYGSFLDTHDQLRSEINFSDAYDDELRWYIDRVILPPNIAKTEALMENVFATIACTMTRTPLIIVGDPGSSKTLSFNIVAANLKGKESKIETYRHTDIFQSLDPHFYQCSRRTTSKEVEKTFKKAINRQHSLTKSRLPILCVVFMDEAGLPEEKLESLKVLHYYLDEQEVSFVAISNHVLDASKTNRAVSLFRPKPKHQELHELAEVNIFPENRPSRSEGELLNHFCKSYIDIVGHEKLKKLFGLRDFIHFVIYMRCNRKHLLDAQLILEALERNFNGSESFEDIHKIFFEKIPACVSTEGIQLRSILDILKDSQVDCTTSEGDDIHKSIQSEVRYKLIIDPSEDDSLVRLLFTYGVLQRKDTRLFICSDFTGDSRSRVNTVVQIMHSVAAGHTILMCQTDEIHESFYDLFNQRFRSIKDPKHGTRFYTNIAIGAHSKLCRVNPAFQCIVVIKKSEVEDTPPPFLNRFEKYYLTHQSLLETVLSRMPPNLRILLEAAHKKAAEFISCVKQPNLYGCTGDTLDSLLLTLLPPTDHKYIPLHDQQNVCEESEHICIFFLKLLLKMLRENAGFHIPKLLAAEVEKDAIYIFKMVLQNPEFESALAVITHEKVAAVINEALDGLHQLTDTGYLKVHTDALMVIAVLMQWFVSYLCKRLMQLVPPEAIPVHCGGIPTMYIKNYLEFQEHFSLKERIDQQLLQLQGNDWDRSVCPTKLLCFTRSSALIHQLPTEYPTTATASTRTTTKDVENLVSEHIFSNLDLLSICKVTVGHSQNKLEKKLFSFATSKYQVLVLIANMQELTKRMVNHLRIMIEEAESRTGDKKLFVLLLHFPPLMFFNPCYPSLFLQGWSHHYLDAIACGTLTRVVDIKSCFYHCCFSDSLSDPEESQMLKALNKLLPEAIPVIASRVAFTCELSNGSITELNASQRTELLQKFFNTNTGENKCSGDGEGRDSIAQILTAKFCKYWTPQLMVQQIDQVSRSMYAQESTLNITDSIQSIVRAAFFDFLVYMFTRINEDHNIEKDGSPVVWGDQLFLTLLREIRVPELAQLKNLNTMLRPQQEYKKAKCVLKFPFFKYVCEILDRVIDESREDVNRQFNIEKTSASLHPTRKKTRQNLEMLYMEVVMARILKAKLQGCLGVAIKAMDDEQGDTIWRQYFDDFVTYKLDLDSEPTPLTRDIIDAYISPLKTVCSDSLSQMVSLHVYFHVHHLDLKKVSRILSQIYIVEKEMATLSPNATSTATLSFMKREDITSASRMPPSLGSFIVRMLFDFISSTDAAASESLQCWYKSYRDIMSVPAVVENVLSNLTSLYETQLCIMHTTYLVMDLLPQRGNQVFTTLLSKHGAECIRLREAATIGLQTMKGASSVQLDEESYCLQSFMEGLFSFFFSKHRILFDEEDCKYFLELANEQPSTSTTQAVDNCLSINMLKLYLAKILGEPEHSTSSQPQVAAKAGHTVLFPLNSKYREMVGKVLAAQSDLGSPGPYIPTFYQLKEKMDVYSCESSKNALMQQPLAHLYFLTVLEHLQTRKYQPTHLSRLAGKISMKDSTQNTERILLFIEKQAVIQMLIYEVATYFDPKDPSKLHGLFNTKLNERVNPLFTDEATGGSRSTTCVSCHALVLAMHLQKQYNPWELIQLLSDDTSTLVKNFSLMKPLQTLIQPLSQPKCEAHLFPFLNDDSDLACFYKKICHAMISVSQSQENIDALTKLAKESCSSEHKMNFTTSYGNLLVIDEKKAFRMLLWLCVYTDFYAKKLHSRSLADTLNNGLRGVLEPEFIGLLKSFIYPGAEMIDPTDPADIELCHAMANTVAIVLACEPRSNHLWYHMFAADALSGSYMTGFMYPERISENCLYDCGVELSRDGMYGRPDYLPHATRGTLSLHSLYFILWTNFSAFYMALVTQPDALEKIRGPIISPRQDIHHYCVGQLRNAWLHMGNKLSLSPKEQSFFIMQCMERLLEISITQPTLLQTGRFDTPEELDAYERIWHKHIFEQSLKNIHSKFAGHCHLHENKLFQNVSCLKTYYPHFPTMDEFTHTMLSSVDINSAQNKFYVLSIFALEHRRLQAAGSLLPDLLELYHWIHNELAYLVTYEDARSEAIEDVIEKYGGLELVQLYERVRDGYNSYVEMVGHYIKADTGAGVEVKEGVNKIADSTKFIDFLSAETDDEQWEGSDLLYLITNDIIGFHNSFLLRVFNAVCSSEHSSLRKYFPEKLKETVYSTEVNDSVMIIPRQSSEPKAYEVEQIVHSRHLQPTEQRSGTCPFDLHRLQIDVIQAFLAGKPLMTGNRIRFRFKNNTIALEGADLDLSVISQGIKEEFKLQLEEKYASQLLLEFHMADYQLLAEVVRGLRVAIEHLKSELNVKEAELVSKKLSEFLLLVFKQPKTTTLEDFGIKNLSSSQLACLQALKLPYLYSTMKLFVNWVTDGMYDFRQLPFVMKKHLKPEDEEVLGMLDTSYEGTLSELLQELQLLTDNLVKSESHLKKTIAKNMKEPIMKVLKGDGEIEKPELIPDTVLCQHYVWLRIKLRHKMVDLQDHRQEDQGSQWVEQVEDLWTVKLKHLWDAAETYDYSDYTFQFDPGAGEYGLYGYHWKLLTPTITEEEQEKKPEQEVPPSTVRKEQLEEVAEQLSVADITEFLKTDGKLEQYVSLFEENEIDGAILFSYTKETLQTDLGIANGLHCAKIVTKFKKYMRAKFGQ